MSESTSSRDLIVIGGGINGAGIALDAAMRGLDVLLLEAVDFGCATSAWSTRLIHGGLRYLEYAEIGLVYESLHERRRLRQNAPHLVKPLRITIPIYRGAKRGRTLIKLGMLAYDVLSWGKAMPRHRMLSPDELLAEVEGLNTEGLVGGAQYYDAQVSYIERLVLEIVLAASQHGAEVRNYSPVTGIQCGDDGEHRVRYQDHSGEEQIVTAPVVINAAGPWVDAVLELSDEPSRRLMGGTVGSHIVVGTFEGAPENALYVEARADSRPIFVVPWNQQYLIGTTDIRIEGDPRDARASDEEIDYLIAEANRVFPLAGLSTSDINFTYAGVRPLPYQKKGPESAITRRHIIHKHKGRARGIISIIGGKLTTYRNLAEQAVDQVGKLLKRRLGGSPTRDERLPGAVDLDAAAAVLDELDDLSDAGRQRLLTIYGGRLDRLARIVFEEPELGNALDTERTVIGAEVALAVREEFARDLTDIVHRRTMVGLSENLGAHITLAMATIAADELGWDSAEAERQLSRLNAHNAQLRRSG